MRRCETCGAAFLWPDSARYHKCPPEWLVWDAEDSPEESGSLLRALSADFAAEKYAEQNAVDFDYLEEPVTLCVRSKDGEVTRWLVAGEAEVVYTATEVTE